MSGVEFTFGFTTPTPPAPPSGAPLLPRITDIVDAGKADWIAARPTVEPWLVSGRYAEVLAGWKAQAQWALWRLSTECSAAKMSMAEGRALAERIADYFDEVVDMSPVAAIGEVVLTRSDYVGKQPGLIKAGTRFRREGDQEASPPVQSATYETTEPVYVTNAYTGTQSVTVKVRATEAGASSNCKPYDQNLILVDRLFDSTLVVASSKAAGGASTASDRKMRLLAGALGTSQDGPTLPAVAAGLLTTSGVEHVAVVEPGDGSVLAWIADESWCHSTELASRAWRNVKDTFLGFGCKLTIGRIVDRIVSVSATVQLKDKRFIEHSDEIRRNVAASLKEYFDWRNDWYAWTSAGVAAAITRADNRILSASTIVLKDSAGATISQPSQRLPTTNTAIYHNQIDEGNLVLSFADPS